MLNIELKVDDHVLCHCLDRILVFCALDAYRRYDLCGAELNVAHGDVIHRDHVRCINVMNARSPVAAWELLMPAVDLLATLPVDKHLLELSGAEWQEVGPVVRQAIECMTSVTGIGLAAATKMLALKRPDLVPACDAQLVDWFGVQGSSDADKAMGLMERFRGIAAQPGNLPSLSDLKAELAQHTLHGGPVCLSTTRILEALCWMETDDGYPQLWRAMGWD